MKKTVRILAFALVAVMAAAAAGCIRINYPAPDESEKPTSAPPVSFDKTLIGDWYGVFSVTEAAGKYAANAGTDNDCAMRLALGEDGRGSAYIAVNTVGELFETCTAEASEGGVKLTGKVGGMEVEWKLTLLGKRLRLSEAYGEGGDTMNVEMVLMHCGDEWTGAPIPAGYAFTNEYGFGNVIESMGGDLKKLPEITDKDANLRYTSDEWNGIPEPPEPAFDDEGRTVSSNGVFSLIVPEGFKVTRDDDYAISFKNDGKGVTEVIFYLYLTNDDPLTVLLDPENGFSDESFYHFTIDGFDCYGSATDTENGSRLMILGGDGKHMLEIHFDYTGTAAELKEFIRTEPELFDVLVLGALIDASKAA